METLTGYAAVMARQAAKPDRSLFVIAPDGSARKRNRHGWQTLLPCQVRIIEEASERARAFRESCSPPREPAKPALVKLTLRQRIARAWATFKELEA